MALGYFNVNYSSVVVPYDDEETPVKLTGKKMLPIMEFSPDKIMNESLDIIQVLDSQNSLHFEHYQNSKEEIDSLLNEIGSNVHSLCMPYWIWTPEFNEKSRHYFQSKKEEKRGPFKNLIKNKQQYISGLNATLLSLESKLGPFYHSQQLTIVDIMIASHLWGMYIFPEFQFSEKIHRYLMNVKEKCHFDYHQDYFT